MTASRSPEPRRLIREHTFAQRSEEVLREMILEGSISPGQRLNEVALAESLGISRGPLREAIQRLASEGIVTVISHRGAFVRTFTREEVIGLYELRTALELHAVRRACQRASDTQLEGLAALLSETQERITEASSHAYPQDLDFHLQLVMLSGNPTMLNRTLETQRQISLARSMSAKRPMRAQAAVAEHGDIVKALLSRDREFAAQLMEQHLQKSLDSAMAALSFPDAAEHDE